MLDAWLISYNSHVTQDLDKYINFTKFSIINTAFVNDYVMHRSFK